MVMIKVPECGQEISDKVQKGTYCGKVLLRRTKKRSRITYKKTEK